MKKGGDAGRVGGLRVDSEVLRTGGTTRQCHRKLIAWGDGTQGQNSPVVSLPYHPLLLDEVIAWSYT